MYHTLLHLLTNLGDTIITLPIATVILVWLAAWGKRRVVALAWLVALIGCAAVTATLKVYFKACPVPGLSLDSPSGHTSMSLFVYGGLILITAAQTRRWRGAVLALGALFILAIATSRVILDYHSKAEVVIGIAIGGIALGLFWAIFRRHRPLRMPLWPSWIAILVPIAFLSGHSISAEGLLGRIAIYVRALTGLCT